MTTPRTFAPIALAPLAMLALAVTGCPSLFPRLGDGDTSGNANTNGSVVSPTAPPIAHAGDDIVVRAGDKVTLSGVQSRDDNQKQLSFIWQQVAGEPKVELTGVFSSFAKFDAPAEVFAETVLTFRLTVVNGIAAASDDVSVIVQPQ